MYQVGDRVIVKSREELIENVRKDPFGRILYPSYLKYAGTVVTINGAGKSVRGYTWYSIAEYTEPNSPNIHNLLREEDFEPLDTFYEKVEIDFDFFK